jgi:rhamnose utilization protein RhaD (predicted bifunctional aldolase and dehydrogenase)
LNDAYSPPVTIFSKTLYALLDLAHVLGEKQRNLAILGEGNVSARLDNNTFLVKASGSNLATLDEAGVVECRFEPLLALLGSPGNDDDDVEAALLGSRVDPSARKPSVEALFHADLLSRKEIDFVGHTHPIAVNRILCSPAAATFAARRLFPDEVVCCGPRSVFVPYADPGLELAHAIGREFAPYVDAHAANPRVILLQNHGIITLGASPEAVKAATFMAVKAAEIYLGAAALGGPVFLDEAVIARINSRKDEHHRQRALGL